MERKLDKRLKDKFEMVGLQPGEIRIGSKFYDTRKMSVKEADLAIKSGVSFIRRTPKKEK